METSPAKAVTREAEEIKKLYLPSSRSKLVKTGQTVILLAAKNQPFSSSGPAREFSFPEMIPKQYFCIQRVPSKSIFFFDG